ncbi:MAG TPA: hypothetical protein VGB92_12865 [Longimicrobium sp.]|jgi:hypothetical protein
MSEESSPSAEKDGAVGIANGAKLLLIAISALVQFIPGYNVLAEQQWYPVGAESFPLIAKIAGSAIAILILVASPRIAAYDVSRVAEFCALCLLGSLAILALYRNFLDSRSVTYEFGEDHAQYRIVIPIGTSRWVGPELLRELQQLNDPPPRTPAGVRPHHFKSFLEYRGAPGAERFPQGWNRATTAALGTGYTAGVALLVLGFTTAAVRLGTGTFGRRSKKGASADDAVGEDAAGGAGTNLPDLEVSKAGADEKPATGPPRAEPERVPVAAAATAERTENGVGELPGLRSTQALRANTAVEFRVEIGARCAAVAAFAVAAWLIGQRRRGGTARRPGIP